MRDRLAALLGVRRGEGGTVGLLVAHFFVLGVATNLFETASQTLFLVRYGADTLPYIYVSWAIAVPLGGLAYGWLQSRARMIWLFGITLAACAALAATASVIAATTAAAWPSFFMLVLCDVFWALILMEFWGLAGHLLDLQQAKRLFGLIGSGEVAGAIVAGVAVGPLIKALALWRVLALAALGFAACIGFMVYLLRTRRPPASGAAEEEEAGESSNVRALLRDRYVLLLLVLPVLFTLAYDFVHYAFFSVAEARYLRDDAAMASFLGLVLTISQGMALFGKTLLSGRVLTRFGLRVALLVLPVTLGVSMLWLLGASVALPGAMMLFWSVTIIRLADAFLRKAIDRPSVLVLYQPLSPEQRLRAYSFQEGFAEPLTAGLSGLVLLAATTLLARASLATKLTYVALFVLGLVAVWLVVVGKVWPAYKRTVEGALKRRWIGDAGALHGELGARVLIETWLASEKPHEVLYALHLLAPLEPSDELAARLAPLLGHPSAEVRADAARRAEVLRHPGVRAPVMERLAVEGEGRVRGALLLALAAVGDAADLGALERALADADAGVRRAAMVGLIKHGGISGVLLAGQPFLQLLRSRDAGERARAADVLGDCAIASFYQPLLELVCDGDVEVRRRAVAAAGSVRNARLWPELVRALEEPALAGLAAAGLAQGGAEAQAALGVALADRERPLRARIQAVTIIGRTADIRDPDGKWARDTALVDRAAALLLPRLSEPEPELRLAVCRAIDHLRFSAEDAAEETVRAALDGELRGAAEICQARVALAGDELIDSALAIELGRAARRILYLLATLRPRASVHLVADNFESAFAARRAYAVELLHGTAPRELLPALLPIFEELTPVERRDRLAALFPALPCDLQALLAAQRPWISTWLRSTAAFAAGKTGSPALLGAVEKCVDEADPVLRETARWAKARLAVSLAVS